MGSNGGISQTRRNPDGMWRLGGPLLKTAVSPSHCQAPAMTLFTRTLSTGPSLMARILTSNISAVRQGMLPLQTVQIQPVRTRVYYSRTMGTPRTVGAVVLRFFRLNNGQWIRPQAGRAKRLWRKEPRQQARLKQHLCVNATQCRMLDKMVNKRWKEKSYFVDDPYEPYHSRERLPHYNFKRPKFLP